MHPVHQQQSWWHFISHMTQVVLHMPSVPLNDVNSSPSACQQLLTCHFFFVIINRHHTTTTTHRSIRPEWARGKIDITLIENWRRWQCAMRCPRCICIVYTEQQQPIKSIASKEIIKGKTCRTAATAGRLTHWLSAKLAIWWASSSSSCINWCCWWCWTNKQKNLKLRKWIGWFRWDQQLKSTRHILRNTTEGRERKCQSDSSV